MNIKVEIKQLVNSRMLKSDEDIEHFEEAIENIISLEDPSYIPELCKGFDDNTNEDEVMFGLIHAIESFSDHIYVEEFLKAIPDMIPHARNWLKILHYRLLNDDNCRSIYSQSVLSVDNKLKVILVDILKDIKNEDESLFNEKISIILKSL